MTFYCGNPADGGTKPVKKAKATNEKSLSRSSGRLHLLAQQA
jgi:hypothetical protein